MILDDYLVELDDNQQKIDDFKQYTKNYDFKKLYKVVKELSKHKSYYPRLEKNFKYEIEAYKQGVFNKNYYINENKLICILNNNKTYDLYNLNNEEHAVMNALLTDNEIKNLVFDSIDSNILNLLDDYNKDNLLSLCEQKNVDITDYIAQNLRCNPHQVVKVLNEVAMNKGVYPKLYNSSDFALFCVSHSCFDKDFSINVIKMRQIKNAIDLNLDCSGVNFTTSQKQMLDVYIKYANLQDKISNSFNCTVAPFILNLNMKQALYNNAILNGYTKLAFDTLEKEDNFQRNLILTSFKNNKEVIDSITEYMYNDMLQNYKTNGSQTFFQVRNSTDSLPTQGFKFHKAVDNIVDYYRLYNTITNDNEKNSDIIFKFVNPYKFITEQKKLDTEKKGERLSNLYGKELTIYQSQNAGILDFSEKTKKLLLEPSIRKALHDKTFVAILNTDDLIKLKYNITDNKLRNFIDNYINVVNTLNKNDTNDIISKLSPYSEQLEQICDRYGKDIKRSSLSFRYGAVITQSDYKISDNRGNRIEDTRFGNYKPDFVNENNIYDILTIKDRNNHMFSRYGDFQAYFQNAILGTVCDNSSKYLYSCIGVNFDKALDLQIALSKYACNYNFIKVNNLCVAYRDASFRQKDLQIAKELEETLDIETFENYNNIFGHQMNNDRNIECR